MRTNCSLQGSSLALSFFVHKYVKTHNFASWSGGTIRPSCRRGPGFDSRVCFFAVVQFVLLFFVFFLFFLYSSYSLPLLLYAKTDIGVPPSNRRDPLTHHEISYLVGG